MKKINLKILKKEWHKELKILKEYPLKISLSFATGIFIGFTPTIGFQTILCYLISRLIGGSFIIMFIGSSIPTGIPYFIPFTYYGCYRVGLFITKTHPVFTLSEFRELKSFLSWIIINIGKPLIYGCLICGFIGWIISFLIIYSILNFKNKKFLPTFLSILWEWVIIPFLFYLIFKNKKFFEFVFPKNNFLSFFIFLLYFISGLILTVFSFYCLHKKGKGTIIPLIPTKKLVKENVYFYCRNPMYLGYSFLYFAFSFLLKNIWFSFISLGIFLFMFILAKIFEEKKLYERFGEEYQEYKKDTPFIIPSKILYCHKKEALYYFFWVCFILCIFIFLFNINFLLFLFKNKSCLFSP